MPGSFLPTSVLPPNECPAIAEQARHRALCAPVAPRNFVSKALGWRCRMRGEVT